MKTYLNCIPCFFKKALEAASITGASQETQKRILNELAKILPEFSLNSSLLEQEINEGDQYANI